MSESILILDFDGVVTDLDIDWKSVYKDISDMVGYEVNNLITFWESCFGTELFNTCNKIIEKYEFEAIPRAKLYEDVKPAFESFKGPIYIASMQSQKVLDFFLSKYDLKHYFKEVLGRDNFGTKKRQIQYIMDRECDHKDFVLVDDLQRNIDDCSYLNIRFILFNRKNGDNLINVIEKVIQ
jgi:phosphoglycolate phosphatase-like HAD superfamily hydrolase